MRKVSLGNRPNQKRISQAKTNIKTTSSFNSGNSFTLNNNNLNICEILNKDGWNALHYASYLGLDEILEYILNKYCPKSNINLNINITNNEGWSPLLLAVFKQHIKCVEILLGIENIDVNYSGDMGSALHLACKKNNRQIVSKLICKADPKIKDKNKKIALEYTSDKGIIKLISKVIYKKFESVDKNNKLYDELGNFIKEYKHILIHKKHKDYNNNINTSNNKNNININFLNGEILPEKPPFFFGEIKQLGGFFSSNKKKYIEINPIKGILRIFKLFEDYPKNPSQTINLIDIINCTKDEEQNIQKNYFFFNINYYLTNDSNNENEFLNKENNINDNNNIKDINNNKIYNEKYLVDSMKSCDDIVSLINKEITFNKFWNGIIKKYKEKKSEIIKYLSNEKFNTLKFELEDNSNSKFILLDDLGKEIPLDETIFKLNTNNTQNKIQNENININQENQEEPKTRKRSSATINIDDFDQKTKTKINFNSFEILELIGGGSFGKVYKVKQKNTGKIYAMKVLNKSYLIQKKLLRYAITECNVLKQSDCPFIIKLHYSFQTPDNLYMILDYCPIGDLSYQIQIGLFEEDEAKFYIAELILAIEYLHKRDIIYRDLKPENILIDEDGHFKLADFGLAKENVTDNTPTKTFCGSLQYLTPEMLAKEGSTKSSDIYGIGVILFEMISGAPPFYNDDRDLMYRNISENKLMFPEFFSEELKDLLKKMLDKDPKKRIGIGNDKQDLKKHPFFADLNWELILNKKITPPMEMVDVREEYNLKEKEKVDLIDEDYNKDNANLKRIPGFSFIKKDI
jgi:serine/threonine protein kinase/ankyrin repeat protein